MKIFSILMIAGVVVHAACPCAAADPGVEVITADEILGAGLTRLGDILLLADSWTVNTKDGFDWQASPNGLSTTREQGWLVMVDGQFMDIRLFDSINLNLLPVPLAAVDSVEIISQPQLYGGRFTDRGLIHIHTRRPGPGISLLGEIVAGNETGDPGPYAYTDLATPNIDAIGPDAAVVFGYHRPEAYVQATISTGIHFFRDPAMLERNTAILDPLPSQAPLSDPPVDIGSPGQPALSSVLGRWGFSDVSPGMQKLSASLRGGIDGFAGRHEPYAGYTETERYFLYVKELGRELPVHTRFAHIGLKGEVAFSSDAMISYRLNHSSHQLRTCPNALDADLNWDRRIISGNIEGRYGNDPASITGGLGWERYAPRTSHVQTDISLNIIRLYTMLQFRPFNDVRQAVGFAAARSDHHTAIQSYISMDWVIHPGQALQAHLSYSERLPEENQGLRYWAQQGLVAWGDLGAVYMTDDRITKSSQFTADLTWRAAVSSRLTITSTASVRYFDDLFFESQSFAFDSTDCSFSSPLYGHGLQAGAVVGTHVRARHRISSGWSHRLSYRYQTDVSGDTYFRQAWQTVPRHRVSYRMEFQSARNIDLWGMLSYLSRSTWPDYSPIEGVRCESDGSSTTYRQIVDGFLVLDLQVQKWFWHRRLRGELLCRNVWNEVMRYHPIGASFDLTFYAGLRFRLGAD